MKHYMMTGHQRAASGFTDVFKLSNADSDFVTNATTAVTLTALNIGDVVFRVFYETKTLLAGPATGTLSIGVTAAVTQFTAATDIKATALVSAIAAVTPFPVTGATNLIGNTVLGAGAVTAGEVWIWAQISRINQRLMSM